MKKILVLAALFVCAEAAYGLASMQVFYNYRMQKNDVYDNSAHLVKLSGHVSPLPLIPASLGVVYFPWVGYTADKDNNEESVSGMEVAVELMGWLPMVPFVTPYAKINYTVWGYRKVTHTEASGWDDKEQDVGGMELGLGVGYDVLPFVTLVAEVSQGLRKVEYENETDENKKFNATTLSIGVEVGI